jgi:hypothetical protein
VSGDSFDTPLLPCQESDHAIISALYGMDAIFRMIAPVVKPREFSISAHL